MVTLSTSYCGIPLKNPIIAGSSGLTSNIDNLIKLERSGVAAVVIKSLFEEQIRFEYARTMANYQEKMAYPEADDYIRQYTQTKEIEDYLSLIVEAKSRLKIPVIASVNCITSGEWTDFAKRIETAGADAIELNIFLLPVDENIPSEDIENRYYQIVEKVMKVVSIPVTVKLGSYFSNPSRFMIRLSWLGVKGIVLFNKPYSPDIDIDQLSVSNPSVLSSSSEYHTTLRWMALLSPKVQCDLSATTGIHDGATAIKQILAGASNVQIASILYKDGFDVIQKMLSFMEEWMERSNFNNIMDFRGILNYKEVANPAAFERVQFMRYFSGIE